MSETWVAAWKICDAPAGGCGFGPRRRVWTSAVVCSCGSRLRAARLQPAPPVVVSTVEHFPRYTRYPRGRSPVFNRPTFGWEVQCSCGWTARRNGGKRDAAYAFRIHRAEARRGTP